MPRQVLCQDERPGIARAVRSSLLGTALTATLNGVLDVIANEKTSVASSALQDFINQANAQRDKALDAVTADGWIQQAMVSRAALGC